MKAQYASDLHIEWHRDGGKGLIREMQSGANVLVLAGDIASASKIKEVLRRFCNNYEYVVYVPGNHEYYGSNFEKVNKELADAGEDNDNLHVLQEQSVEIEGQRFVGTTLWFEEKPDNVCHEQGLDDFFQIKGFKDWVYDLNRKAMQWLRDEIKPGDIVVTHHLPSKQSTPARFADSEINRFFVCDVEDIMRDTKPAFWIHGHTHDTCNYRLFDTRVVCNPFGYVGYKSNAMFDPKAILELD